MIPIKDIVFTNELLSKNKVNELLGLEKKYFDAFVDVVCWRYRNTDTADWDNSRFQRVSSFFLKIAIMICGTLYSIINYQRRYRNLNVIPQKTDIIALPFCGAHVRFRYIYELLGDEVCVQYPPIFHYDYLRSHIDCFKKYEHSVGFNCFSIRDVLNVSYVVLKNYRKLRKVHFSLDNYYERNYGYFASTFITSLLYRRFICRFLNKISKDSSYKKWLFDYDFDYKYIIFNSEVKKCRPNDVTFHIQHGSFFHYSDHYCNPVSDVSICCSPREKQMIENSNKYNSKIFAQGSSWQSIDMTKTDINSERCEFDVLVLLTDTIKETKASFQKLLLENLRKIDATILVRYRPQTASIDKNVLQKYTIGMTISGFTTLKEDIMQSKVIICFSEDAIYECFRNGKKTIFLVQDESLCNSNVAKSDNIYVMTPQTFNIDIIRGAIDNPNSNYLNDEFVRFNFGDFEFSKIKLNLNEILNKF